MALDPRVEPLARAMCAAAGNVVMQAAYPKAGVNLDQLRELLLPTVWVISGQAGFDAEIQVCGDGLIVMGRKGDKTLSFAVTKDSIESGAYRSQFGPSCMSLRDGLLTPDELENLRLKTAREHQGGS